MPDLNTAVESILTVEEDFRGNVYDDATGEPIMPGSIVRGNPTVGYGVALNKSPLMRNEALYLLRNRYQTIPLRLNDALEWFSAADPVRQAVFVCMAYQIGVSGFLKFTDTLHAASVGDWARCAAEMLNSEWARQTAARAKRMSEIIRTGAI